MKQNLQYLSLFLVAWGALAACSTAKRQAEKVVSTTPAPYVLTPDSINRVSLDMCFHIPAHYMSGRSRLFITPQLVKGDTVQDEYFPLVVDAPIYSKKMERQKILDAYNDPYEEVAVKLNSVSRSFSLPYKNRLQLPENLDEGRVVAVISSDGCGECSGIDTIDVAAISNPVTLMPDVKEVLQLTWIEPQFVVRPKIREGKGVAHLQFVINKSDINLSMGNNQEELEQMLHTLGPILEDSLATVTSLTIAGMASADGSFAFNTTLARNRAASARQWLINQLDIRPEVQQLISISSRPEGWEPVLAAMTADGNPDSAAVKKILEEYNIGNDDVQEYHIRRLSCWNKIKSSYLQKDRKVEYVYTYTMKSFTTDAELLDMYRKRPDAFNEEELLRVATLVDSPDGKKEVYQVILKYFPQSQIAANNLAVLYLREGNSAKALETLAVLAEHSPEVLNTLAVGYVYADNYEKAIELLQDVELPEARYNLGLIKAKKRCLGEAYELLRPFADLNSAIAALSINKNTEAKSILAGVKDDRPVAEYVRSLTAARLEEHSSFYRHIGNACTDDRLLKRAATEPDFYRYHKEDTFRRLINKR